MPIRGIPEEFALHSGKKTGRARDHRLTIPKKSTGASAPVLVEKLRLEKLPTTEIAAATAASATAATATAAVITEFAARAVETSATAARRTVFARTGFVDSEGAPVEIFSVKGLDGGLRFGVGTHRDECEPA